MCILPYSDKQWLSFFTAVGRPEMMEIPGFATYSARVHTVDELYGFVAGVTPEKTTAEWVEICERGEIPCMPVADIQELMDDEHLKAVGMFEPHDHPSEGATILVRSPVTFSASPADSGGSCSAQSTVKKLEFGAAATLVETASSGEATRRGIHMGRRRTRDGI